MKKKDFVLREMANEYVLIPFGTDALDFNGIIKLNETAKFMWESIDSEIDTAVLKAKLIEKYSIGGAEAQNAVDIFIAQMKEAGCIG